MNTTLSRSATRPPDTEDRQVLRLPAPSALRELAFADRVTFRLGLWLLERAQRPRRRPGRADTDPSQFGVPAMNPRDSVALLTFDLQRQLR